MKYVDVAVLHVPLVQVPEPEPTPEEAEEAAAQEEEEAADEEAQEGWYYCVRCSREYVFERA